MSGLPAAGAISRRHALGLGLGAALSGCARTRDFLGLAHPRPGLQLYSVRDAVKQDMAAALHRVAGIGYREVEFAGYYGHSGAQIRHMLDAAGLVSPSAHVDALAARDDPMPQIEHALQAGHRFLVIGWIPPEGRKTIDQWKEWALVANRFAQQCHLAGLSFCYHNNDFDFHPIGGIVPYDVMLAETDPALVRFELDIYWAKLGGGDPLAILTRNRGRFPMCHLKEMLPSGAMADLGVADGTIDYPAIFANDGVAPFEHYFFEDDDARDQFASAGASFGPLKAMLDRLPAA